MGDNEGTQVDTSGTQAKPGAENSGGTNADVSDIRALFSGLSEQIQALEKELKTVKKSQQKTKDKRIYQLQEQIGSLEDQTARLEKHLGLGKSPAEAMEAVKAEIQQEQFVQDFQSVKEKVENLPAGNSQKSLAEREAVILRSLGLDANDPSIVALQKEASSPEEYVEKLESSWWDMKRKPVAGPADSAPKNEGPPPGEPSVDELRAALNEEMSELRSTGQAGDIRAVQAIRQKYLDKYPKLVGHI